MADHIELTDEEKLSDAQSKPHRGRPKGSGKPRGWRKIDWTSDRLKIVEKFAEAQCTDEEIARAVGCTREHFNRTKMKKGNVREAYEIGRARGRSNVRVVIYNKAKKGDLDAATLLARAWFSKEEDWSGLNSKSPAVINNNLIGGNSEPNPAIAELAKRLAEQAGPRKIIEGEIVNSPGGNTSPERGANTMVIGEHKETEGETII